MKPPTDAALRTRTRRGDRIAAGILQARHEGIIGRVISQQGYPKTSESYQTGRIALHAATLAFRSDPAKARNHNAFLAYAATAIRHALSRQYGRAARSDLRCGMVTHFHQRGPVPAPQRKPPTSLIGQSARAGAADLSSVLPLLSPLPRVVCRLLAAGIDPVKRLGLYRGELDRIRERAFQEVA